MANKNRDVLVPDAKQALEKIKMEAANETLGREMTQHITPANYQRTLAQKKEEAAADLGLSAKIENEGWRNMTTREVGQIGGQMGGKIGGQMVKKIITAAENQMAPVAEETRDLEGTRPRKT